MEIRRASVVSKSCLPLSSIPLQIVAKERNVLDKCLSNLWAIELGICCSNVYGEKSAAPLNMFSSVYKNVCYDC